MVVYSADITQVETKIDAGSIKYKVEPFYMKELDGDEKLAYLSDKINNREHLTSADILTLTLAPLMHGKESSGKRAIKSIDLAEKIPETAEKLQCVALLYAFLDKFGDSDSKKKFMGVISMTEIGKMIREEGKAEGKAEGKTEMLIKLIIKKLKDMPNEYKENIKKLPEETIDVIAADIFDLKSLQELEKYFR